MSKRSLAVFLLVAAFLLSAWENVIGTAFCPRYLAQNCFAHSTHQATQVDPESCHHEMSDMDMGDMPMDEDVAAEPVSPDRENPMIEVAAESSFEQSALDVPTEPCGHCWMHSQPSSGSGTLAATNLSPRSVEALAPPSEATIAQRFPNLAAIEPLEHSPPGSSLPRHILINVFRI